MLSLKATDLTRVSSPVSSIGSYGKSLIVHADDFGMTLGISQGILKGFRSGIVTSSSILSNVLTSDMTLLSEVSKQGWDLGVHLNLTEGRACGDNPRLKILIDQDGHFRGPLSLFLLWVAKMLPWNAIEAEMEAQIERVLETGVSVSHLDCHHHIHLIPGIFHLVLKLARQHGINRVRQVSESLLPYPLWAGEYRKLRRIQAWLAHCWAKKQRYWASAAGVRTPHHFFGIAQCGHRDPVKAFGFLFEHLPEGISELMCHPGLPDALTHRDSRDPLLRLQELNALLDPVLKECLVSNGIRLISYQDL